MPSGYESLLRVHPPAPSDHWWPAYQELFGVVASIGEQHTAVPDAAWFAVWEGHGFDKFATRVAWHDPPADAEERRARAAERQRLEAEDERRRASMRAELARIPRFDRPDRTYYLLGGAVSAVTDLRFPDFSGWRNPDLCWPDDRRWFVATDVDVWSLYVGGARSFTEAISGAVPTPVEPVEYRDRIDIED